MYNVKIWRYDNNRIILKIYSRDQKRIFYLSRNETFGILERTQNIINHSNRLKAFILSFFLTFCMIFSITGPEDTTFRNIIHDLFAFFLVGIISLQQWPNGKRITFRQTPFKTLCYMFIVIHSFRIWMLFLLFFLLSTARSFWNMTKFR